MTLEELLELARTPLPGPPMVSDEQATWVKERAKALAEMLPDWSGVELPMMPEWMRRYSAERGLLPPAPSEGSER